MVPASVPGSASGQTTRRKVWKGGGAKAERRLLDRARDAFDHALQGEHHIGQVDRDDADHHGHLGVHEGERLIDDADRHQGRLLMKPLAPNSVIQPAARTALPMKSGSTTRITMRFFQRDVMRASQ